MMIEDGIFRGLVRNGWVDKAGLVYGKLTWATRIEQARNKRPRNAH